MRLKTIGSVSVLFVIFSSMTAFAQLNDPEPMLPIYKDPPYYPRSAAEQRIEGWVHVAFDVLKDGTVDKSSIVILDEEPTGIFTRPAIQSAESLRFNPRLSEDGNPVLAKGVTYLFQFAMRAEATDGHFSDSYKGRPPPSIED